MKIHFAFIIFLLAGSLFSQGKNTDLTVLATNRWTAAYVEAATGEDCFTLAPQDLIHPPEYELTPGDFEKISGASTLVIAGYEAMVPKIRENEILAEENILQIDTGFNFDLMSENIKMLGSYFGTEETAAESIREIGKTLKENGDLLKAEGSAPTVVVHQFQVALAKELGLEVLGVFGPAPLQAADIEKISALDPSAIIDNGHNPQGVLLTEILTDSAYVEWINFPGRGGTESLTDVIQWNREQLQASLK